MVRRTSFGRLVLIGLVAVVLLSGMAAPLIRPSNLSLAQEDSSETPAPALIAAALESGEIDYDTSLVYRAYALFGDPRLPDEFAGSGSVEDLSLIGEAQLNWDNLSPSTRDRLTPFLVRPTDDRSFFAVESAQTVAGEGCTDGWISVAHETYPIRFWIPCTGDYTGDLATVVSLVDEFWQPEVDLMGPPKLDAGGSDGGGDTRLDFYVLDDPDAVLPRDGGIEVSLGTTFIAMAMATDPIVDKTASAFMFVRRAYVGEETLKFDLAHEFFHALQYAHNAQISWGFSGRPLGEFEVLQYTEYWFVEATARWLESYLFRGKVPDATMALKVHSFYTQNFHSDLPLYTSVDQQSPLLNQMYGAYIWFYFVEQEIGPQAIGQLWRDLESVDQDDFAGTLTAIDAIYPFDEHFRDFAVRNLNLNLQPGDPISPSYRDQDSAFPEGVRPHMTVGGGSNRSLGLSRAGNVPWQHDDTIEPLSAHYYYLVPEDHVTSFTFDFSGMTPTGSLDVDLIVKITGKGWERRQLSTAEPTTLCRANPADNVEALYLVLSNHTMAPDGAVSGPVTIPTSSKACE